MNKFEAACDIYPEQYMNEPRPRCLDGVARRIVKDGNKFVYTSQTGRKYTVEEV